MSMQSCWASLHPVHEHVRKEVPAIQLIGDLVFVGKGASLNDVDISESVFGCLAQSVQFWHMELYPEVGWLHDRDWTGQMAELEAQTANARIARARLMDGRKVWVSHYTQELQCCKLTRYDRCEHCEYIDLFHGDTIHLVPPRVSWELSFTLRAEVRSVRGVEMDDDGELVAMRRLRGRRRQRKRISRVIKDDDTSSEEE